MNKITLVTDSIPVITNRELKYVKKDLRTLGNAISHVDDKIGREREEERGYRANIDSRIGLLSDSFENKDYDKVANDNRVLKGKVEKLENNIKRIEKNYKELFFTDNKQDLALELKVKRLEGEVNKSWTIWINNSFRKLSIWIKSLWK